MALGQRDERLDVAQPALRVAAAQPGIERFVARRGVLAAVVERAVDREYPCRGQQLADAGEHALDLRPGHDMQGIRGEDRVDLQRGKRTIDIQLDWLMYSPRLRLLW